VFLEANQVVEQGDAVLRRKINQLQNKLSGGGKGLQKQLEKEQIDTVHQALTVLDRARPFYRWGLFVERQTNTKRAELHYQIKEFDEADKYFRKSLVLHPVTLAMKMTRLYQEGDWKAFEKAFRKGVRSYRDEHAVVLYALYSWALVQENRVDDAIQVLAKAKDETEDEVLKTNWEHLVNGRVRRFSNAGLGDDWYRLHLEAPKPVKMRQRTPGWMR